MTHHVPPDEIKVLKHKYHPPSRKYISYALAVVDCTRLTRRIKTIEWVTDSEGEEGRDAAARRAQRDAFHGEYS
jgi:hypothetical protein